MIADAAVRLGARGTFVAVGRGLALDTKTGVDAAGAFAAGDIWADVARCSTVVEGVARGFRAADCVALALVLIRTGVRLMVLGGTHSIAIKSGYTCELRGRHDGGLGPAQRIGDEA